MLHVWAEEVFSIGTVTGVLQPVVVADKLRNVPKEGIYSWDPGAYFGIYKPDQFWFGEPVTPEQSASAGAAPAAPR
jgi:peptide/nickel transport system substrate-binding protein